MTKESVPVTKEKEIYNTSYIDKNLSTICVVDKNVVSSTEWSEVTISVSDATAKGAFEVFKQVLKELE